MHRIAWILSGLSVVCFDVGWILVDFMYMRVSSIDSHGFHRFYMHLGGIKWILVDLGGFRWISSTPGVDFSGFHVYEGLQH